MSTAPAWITSKGLLFTATELTPVSLTITATNTSSYLLLNGSLPNGLNLNTETGIISGIADAVLNLSRYKFTVRAYNNIAFIDRTFFIDVEGADLPVWETTTLVVSTNTTITTSTTEGYLAFGDFNVPYAFNKQYIDLEVKANLVESPENSQIKYYIPNISEDLPKNLKLSENGRLQGILDCFTIEDLNTTSNSLTAIYNPKEYQFYINASDGISEQSRLFKLAVVDPNMLRAENTITNIEILNVSFKTQPYSYLIAPQFLQEENLGTIRAENYYIIPVNAYDPYPSSGVLLYSLITGTTITSNIPVGFQLDEKNGNLYGYISYQPSFSKSYTFDILAKKIEETITSTIKTFSLSIKGLIENNIKWISTSSLGSIYEGQISDLYIQAQKQDDSQSIKYNKISGILPNGLSFQSDGTITGKVEYNTSGTYIFTATAQDVYELNSIQQEFNLKVLPSEKKYTQIYIKSFLPENQKQLYLNFINNENIFIPKYIYRYYDQNFGLQKDFKLFLEFNIEQIELENFYPTLSTNFYRKRFYFSEVKNKIIRDNKKNIIYELIYLEVIDDQMTNNTSVDLSFTLNNTVYYPSSIDNMKYRLQNIQVNNSSTIAINSLNDPKFFNSVALENNSVISYVKYIPICYTIPGRSETILKRILFDNFDFKKFYIETDRLIINNNLTTSGEKYVFFPKKNINF